MKGKDKEKHYANWHVSHLVTTAAIDLPRIRLERNQRQGRLMPSKIGKTKIDVQRFVQ